jgi:hypothetical protein
MKHNWLCVFLITCLVLGFGITCDAADPKAWQAGVAKASITPSDPVWMAGYASRNGPSEGALTELFARAAVLTDDKGHRIVMVTLKLIEITESLREAILKIAQTNHNLKPHELLLNVSHTHGGPMISAKTVADWGIDAGWGSRAESYANNVVKTVDHIIGEAISEQEPVTISYSHARCGFAMNRRLRTTSGFRLGPNPDGNVDHAVPVLRIETMDNRLLGIIFGYACHNTALGDTRQLHGDYAGFAQEKLESDHHGTVALFLTGCGGDQDPSPRRHLEDARQNGLALASAVEGALSATQTSLPAPLATSLETIPIAFSPLPNRDELTTRANSPDGYVSRHARMILEKWPNPGDQPADYQYPVQVLAIGQQVLLIALGGEPVVDYSLRLKKELSPLGKSIWVAGYSNLVNAYIPTRRVLEEGGYEGTEAIIYQSLPTPFSLDTEERIVASVLRQVKAVQK